MFLCNLAWSWTKQFCTFWKEDLHFGFKERRKTVNVDGNFGKIAWRQHHGFNFRLPKPLIGESSSGVK